MDDSNQRAYRLGYRADIEGLRAIAILLVVAAHAHMPGFAGGFVGVDVFFVLSGYLITGLLVQEIRTTGSVRFWRFYARRLRRLMPALFFMLACVGLLAWLLLPVFDQPSQAGTEASAGAWISNFYFASMQVGYFDADAGSNLFLHTWSLGVEEQFYLVWPLLILAGCWTRKSSGNHSNPTRCICIMAILLACSFVLCLAWSKASPEYAFYMMPPRAWQFALGALVYMFFGTPGSRTEHSGTAMGRFVLPGWIGWLGFASVLASAVMLNGNMTYPGAWALMPTVGAAAMIASGAHPAGNSLCRVLSVRPMQMLGRISYSWYLWHWPILLLGTLALGYRTFADRLVLVAVSLVLAAVSYQFVEKPVRRTRWVLARPRIALGAGVLAAMTAFTLANAWSQDAMQEKYSSRVAPYVSAKADTPLIYLMGCDSWYHASDVKPCTVGPSTAAHTVVVFGDSIAMQWFPAIQRIFKPMHWRIVVLTKSACPMVSETYFYALIKRPFAVCSTWRENALANIRSIRPDIVILGSTHDYPFTRRQWIEGTRRLVRHVSQAARKVFLIRSTPALPFDAPACLSPHSRLFRWLSHYPDCTAPAHDRRFDQVYAWQKQAVAGLGNVRVVDMTSTVCPGDQCHARRDGMVAFRDNKHMTAAFARSLAPALASSLGLTKEGQRALTIGAAHTSTSSETR